MRGREFSLFGKPLRWTRGWTAVVLVWLVCGALLGVTRLQMGNVAALTAREQAALKAVVSTSVTKGATYGQVLDLLASPPYASLLVGKSGSRSVRWYAIDRSWEQRVYVVWELGHKVQVTFVVGEGRVLPDPQAKALLESIGRASAGVVQRTQ